MSNLNQTLIIQKPNIDNYILSYLYPNINNGLIWISAKVTFNNPAGPANFQMIDTTNGNPFQFNIDDIINIVSAKAISKTGTGNIGINLSQTQGGVVQTNILTETADVFLDNGGSTYNILRVTPATGTYLTINAAAGVTAGSLECLISIWRNFL